MVEQIHGVAVAAPEYAGVLAGESAKTAALLDVGYHDEGRRQGGDNLVRGHANLLPSLLHVGRDYASARPYDRVESHVTSGFYQAHSSPPIKRAVKTSDKKLTSHTSFMITHERQTVLAALSNSDEFIRR